MPVRAPHRLPAGPLVVCALAALLTLTAGAAPAVGRTSAGPGRFDPLVALVVQRLQTGDVVAAAKWASRGPIEAPDRERDVLAAAGAGAAERGLDPAGVTAIFGDQIAANKVVQYGLFSAWTATPERAPAPGTDLSTVRPVLDRITTGLLDQLAVTAGARDGVACDGSVHAAALRAAAHVRFDEVHRAALTRAVRSLCT